MGLAAKDLIPRHRWTQNLTQFLKGLSVNHDGRAHRDIIELTADKISQADFDRLEDELLTPREGYSYRAQTRI